MTIASKKLCFLLTVIFAYDPCVGDLTGYDGPRFRLHNGTILEDGAEIKIMYGNPLDLYCTGEQAYDFEVTRATGPYFRRIIVPRIVVNQTTTKVFVEEHERGWYDYYCEDNNRQHMTNVRVLVDSLPLALNFHCKSQDLEFIECTWTSLHLRVYSSLSYVENGATFPLCKWTSVFGPSENDLYCKWDETHPVVKYDKCQRMLTFVINTCNAWGCANQIFVIDQAAVVKFGAPYKLYLLQTASRSVTIRWFNPLTVMLWSCQDFAVSYLDCRISYTYSSVHQVVVNFTKQIFDVEEHYDHELKLPCAHTYYELRLSVKLPTAIREQFWSEDAVLSFVTDPESEDNDAIPDPTCKTEEITWDKSIMSYKIYEFRGKMKETLREIKENIKSLKWKRDEINKFKPSPYV